MAENEKEAEAEMKEIINIPAISVFLGTLPLLGSVLLMLLDQRTRFTRLETKLDSLDAKVNGIDVRLARVETKLDTLDGRVARLESNPKLVVG